MSLGKATAHESAALHVAGVAQYCDDIPLPANSLHAAFGISPVAHGKFNGLDLSRTLAIPGVFAVAQAADVPGANNYGAAVHDDPIFATGFVHYAGQPLFAVAAHSHDAARGAARLAVADIKELPAILDIRSALAAESYVLPTQKLVRGTPEVILEQSPHRLSGSAVIGGQDHFYLEGHIAIALPQDDGGLLIHSSTQHPSEVQAIVAHALGCEANRIMVSCRRMGGGFGGKETQPALIAAAAAVLAHKTGRPVKLRLDRDDDMIITGKRHDFLADYDVAFDSSGRITALAVMLASRCGYSADLSGPVNDRAVFHLDNAYFLEHLSITSHRCRTNTVSATAFRGFGGPQGMVVIEQIIDDIARHLGMDPLAVRRRNLYGISERNVTHYGQTVQDNVLPVMLDQLEASSHYQARRAAIAAWNLNSPVIKRGIALTPVKFGISFTATQFNQAGALLQIYTDGSVLLNHGGTEMGQGLHIKVAQVVATELGLPLSSIRVTATDTSKVPNTSATAASAGSDLNGMAALAAAVTLRQRLEQLLRAQHGSTIGDVRFADGQVHFAGQSTAFATLCKQAYNARISLSAAGYYRTPDIQWDKATWTGRPFYYYAYGAAVSEVAIDTLTGESKLLAVDILHDVGTSMNPAIDRGQIEGGFLQGVGWLTSEQLHWDEQGKLRTHSPSTYKIPTARDWPQRFDVRLLQDSPNTEPTIYRSKGVGEPPLMLAISVLHALRDACAAAASPSPKYQLSAPATPEAILRAIGGLPGEAGP